MMRRMAILAGVFAAVASACGPPTFAAETIVDSTPELRDALLSADPGDRIYVAPGYYNDNLWVTDVHGTAENMIEVVALDPTDRPVFEEHKSLVFTLYGCSYIMVDGIIAQGAGLDDGTDNASAGNNIEFPLCHHMILRNSVSRDIYHNGNSDATKFAHSEHILMYNCTVSEWGDGAGAGIDAVGNKRSLFMRNTFTFPTLALGADAKGIVPKNDAYHSGFYRNTFVDGGSRAQQFGGGAGAGEWAAWDLVAMGNFIDSGEAAVGYVTCTNCEFAYNTITDPEKYVMRILREGEGNPTASNAFNRNLVQFGPMLGPIQNIGANTQPETFTFDANYWYDAEHPGVIPALDPRCTQTNPAGGTDPQLDADYRPHLAAAKQYGAYAPQVETAFAQHQSWFQWAWDRAEEIDPKADPGEVYHIGPDQELTFDASDSHAGSGSYDDDPAHPEWHHTITGYAWDLDWDSDFDDGTGETFAVNYWYLRTFLGLSAGWHTIELKITVSTPYGEIVDWGFAQLHIVDTLLPGDANYDGEVNGADYTAWADHYKQAGEWIDGDFNDDGVVDGADYTLWADNFTGGGSAVPEPTTLCLLTLAAAGLLRRRRS